MELVSFAGELECAFAAPTQDSNGVPEFSIGSGGCHACLTGRREGVDPMGMPGASEWSSPSVVD